MNNIYERNKNIAQALNDFKLLKILLAKGIIQYEDVIDKLNEEQIWLVARDVEGAPIEKLAKKIIATGNAKYIYYFARDVKELSLGLKKELAEALIKTEDLDTMCKFVKDVEGAPINKLAKVIIASKNALYILKFAKRIDALPIKKKEQLELIEKLINAMVATNNAQFMYYFALNVKNAPIEKLTDAIVAIKDAYFICEFVKYILNAKYDDFDIYKSYYFMLLKKLAKGVVATGNAEYIYYFARDWKCYPYHVPYPPEIVLLGNKEEALMKELAEGIIATGNAKYIFYFYRDASAFAPKKELIEGVIATGDAEYIYEISRYLSLNFSFCNQDILVDYIWEKLTKGIIATGNAYYIYLFARDVKRAPKGELAKAIIATGDVKYIYSFVRDVPGIDVVEYFNQIPIELWDNIPLKSYDIKLYTWILNYQLNNKKEDQIIIVDRFRQLVKKFLSNSGIIKIITSNVTHSLLINILKEEMELYKKEHYSKISYNSLMFLYNSGNIEEIEKRKEEFAYLFNEEGPESIIPITDDEAPGISGR